MSTANQFQPSLPRPGFPTSYEFGPFVLDTAQHALLKKGKPIALTPKTFDTLQLLVQNSGRMLSKEELMQTLWPDSFVEESNLTQQISMIRRALRESASNPRYIATVPSRGYRFIAQVRNPVEEEIAADSPDLHVRSDAAAADQSGESLRAPEDLEKAGTSDSRLPIPKVEESQERLRFIDLKTIVAGSLVPAAIAIAI